jgi:hypothetical protein
MMVLNRNHTLSTTQGHTIRFRKGEPVGVPKDVEKAAMAIGAEHVVVTDKEAALPQAEAPAAPIPEGDARETAVFNAIAVMEERNERSDFNAAGAPNVGPLSALTGFKVDKEERAKLWSAYREFKAAAATAEASA